MSLAVALHTQRVGSREKWQLLVCVGTQDECCFAGVGCVWASGFAWSNLVFPLSCGRISVRMVLHWLQTHVSCLVKPPNLPQFVAKGVSESISLAINYVSLEKFLVLI